MGWVEGSFVTSTWTEAVAASSSWGESCSAQGLSAIAGLAVAGCSICGSDYDVSSGSNELLWTEAAALNG